MCFPDGIIVRAQPDNDAREALVECVAVDPDAALRRVVKREPFIPDIFDDDEMNEIHMQDEGCGFGAKLIKTQPVATAPEAELPASTDDVRGTQTIP